MLRQADLREQGFAAVGLQIAVVVMKDEDVGRARHDHLAARAFADHADAEGRIDVAALVKHGLLVGHTVAVGVFEHEDAVAFGPCVPLAAVVHHLTHPHPAVGVDIDVGRTRKERLSGEERGREVGRSGQRLRAGLAVGGFGTRRGQADCERAPYMHAKDVHRGLHRKSPEYTIHHHPGVRPTRCAAVRSGS